MESNRGVLKRSGIPGTCRPLWSVLRDSYTVHVLCMECAHAQLALPGSCLLTLLPCGLADLGKTMGSAVVVQRAEWFSIAF